MTPRMTYMINALTAAAVSLAAITSGAVPANAGGKDVAKAAAAIAAIALIAGALQQRQGTGMARSAPLPLPEPNWQTQAGDDWQRRNWQDGGWQDHRRGDRSPSGRGGPVLPPVCAVQIDGRDPQTIYADTCLRREGFRHPLPPICAQEIRSRDWSGRVYDGACLRDAGFRSGRHY